MLRWGILHDDEETTVARKALGLLQLVVIVVVAASVIVPTTFYVMPMPANADGATLCLPVIGPLQQIADGLTGEYEELVHLHEEVHAQQCRDLGAASYNRRYLDTRGRLRLEAEAYCAEIDVQEFRGRNSPRLVSQTVEILYSEYQNEGLVPKSEIAEIVRNACLREIPEEALGEESPPQP